jgi:hypothetical protein
MVTNTLLTIDMITYEALIVLKNSLAFGNRVLRQFDSQFGNEGAKSGDTLRVRKPIRVQTTTGPAPTAQNTQETFVPVASQTQRNVELSYTTKDTSLALDDFSDRVIKPIMAQLASDIDSDGTVIVAGGYSVANTNNFGGQYGGNYAGFQSLATPGAISGTLGPAAWTGVDLGSGASAANTAGQPFFDASARLTEQSAPNADRFCVLSPAAMAATIPNLFNLFNPSKDVGDMFSEGIIGTFAKAKFYESQTTNLFTSGTRTGNANVNVAVVTGATTLTLGRVGNALTVANGDQFVIAGQFAVNPLTRQSTNKLQVFTAVVGGTSDASGNLVLSQVWPALQNTGQYQTVTSASGALPIVGANVVWQGGASVTTSANFMYQKNAIALVVANLADVGGLGAKCVNVTDEEDGMSIRYIEQYQASTDQIVHRLDVLYGWAVVRPELGARIQA